MFNLALQGIRVLDFSRLLPGPFCSLLLADLGAEVVKVEDPNKGDYLRNFSIRGFESTSNGHYFQALNRGKKSVAIDIKTQEGQKLVKTLLPRFDVLIEQYRPGVMPKLGLGYEELSSIKPDLIYCSISGYGQQGEYKVRAGHDLNYIGISGIGLLNSPQDRDPVIPAIQIADLAGGGLFPALCICAALFARSRNGSGQYIDVSMTDVCLSLLGPHLSSYLIEGISAPAGVAPLLGGSARYGIYKTSDGRYMSVAAIEQKFWEKFCSVLDRQDLISYPDGEELKKILREIFSTKNQEHWTQVFKDSDVCCEPLLNIEEVVENSIFIGRKMFLNIMDPNGREKKMVRTAFSPWEENQNSLSQGPYLGQHTDSILSSCAVSQETIKDLREKGIIK